MRRRSILQTVPCTWILSTRWCALKYSIHWQEWQTGCCCKQQRKSKANQNSDEEQETDRLQHPLPLYQTQKKIYYLLFCTKHFSCVHIFYICMLKYCVLQNKIFIYNGCLYHFWIKNHHLIFICTWYRGRSCTKYKQ